MFSRFILNCCFKLSNIYPPWCVDQDFRPSCSTLRSFTGH